MLSKESADEFTLHLDRCHRCDNNPFDLCPEGQALMQRLIEENRDANTQTPVGQVLDVDGAPDGDT